MTLIVEDGTGLATAESYSAVADVATWLTRFGALPWLAMPIAAWTVASEDAQEAFLRNGTRELNEAYHQQWPGRRLYPWQALDWPRFGAFDRDGFFIPQNLPVPQIVDATCILALKSTMSEISPDLDRGGALRSMTVADGLSRITTSKTWAASAQATKIMPLVDQTLARILRPLGYLERG